MYDKFELDDFIKITCIFPNIDVYVRKNKPVPIIDIKLLPEACSKENEIVNEFKDMEKHPKERLDWKCLTHLYSTALFFVLFGTLFQFLELKK